MTCQQQSYNFITQLLVIHPLSVFINGSEQHREQITNIDLKLAPVTYDLINHVVYRLNRCQEAAIARGMDKEGRKRHGKVVNEKGTRICKRLAKTIAFCTHINIEQRLANNLECEIAHGLTNIK